MPWIWPPILALLLATGAGLGSGAIDAAPAAAASRAVPESDVPWQPGLNAPGMDGRAHAFCEYRGDLVVGGSFRTIGTQVIEYIARWDGVRWHPLDAGVNGTVTRMTVQRDKLVASGDFTQAGGAPANRIASWDGTTWRPLGAGVESAPLALAVYRDTLFVGGSFESAGDLATTGGIARWDGNAWHDEIAMADWPLLTVTNLIVAGGRLAGTYLERDPGGDPMVSEPHPVFWNGAGWDAFSYGYGSFPTHLAVLGDSLYASGYGTYPAGGYLEEGNYVTRWTGTEWLPLGRDWGGYPGIPVGHAGALYLARGSALYQWNNHEWIVASRPQHADIDVLFSGSDGLYTGGARVTEDLDPGSSTAHGLARWDGTTWLSVGDQAGYGFNLWHGAPLVVLAPAGEGFSAGGTFLRVGDLQTIGLVRWDGVSWWSLPRGPDPIRANAFLDLDGRLTAADDELLDAGSWVRTLEGSRWKRLALFPGRVLSISPWRDRLVVGGDFAPEYILTAPQVALNPIVVLQSLGGGLNGTVRSTSPLSGSVVASGDFTATADGTVSLRHAGLWDGTAWLPLGDGLPASAVTLEPFAGGVAAGMGDGVHHFNGTAWVPLGETFDGPVQALAVFEGELVAGGAFTHSGSVPLGGLARWRENRWQPIGSGMNDEVQDLLANGEDLWVGGAFSAAGEVPSAGIAHWRESRAGVESLYAQMQQDSASLSWRDPESPTHRSTAVRWSPYAYPADPQDGLALPFGNEGRFPASPGLVHQFRLSLPLDGGQAFYSVFAVHADGLFSAPGHVQVRLPDRTPPMIQVQTHRLADGAARLAITLHCGEPVAPAGVTAWLDSTSVPLTGADESGMLWTGTAVLAGPGSSRVIACARDRLGNEQCAGDTISAAMAGPFVSGRCLAALGRLLVEWPANAFASEGLVTVIGVASASPAFEVSAHESPLAPMVLSFQIPPDDPRFSDPRHLGVLGPGGAVQGGVFDAASRRLIIRTSRLGTHQLTVTAEEVSTKADPQFLDVAPAAPNPFHAGTALGFELRARQRVRVTVYDVGGRNVATLFDGMAGPGEETIWWDGRWRDDAGASGTERAVPSGAYFVRVQTETTNRTLRLVKVR